MNPADVEALFTRPDGGYAFARWGRPIVPVVFGVQSETLGVIKGAVEAVVALAGHKMAETDPEIGANLMIFFFRHWHELLDVPNLDQMIDGLAEMVVRLDDRGANQYRIFRFDASGAIKTCFSFVRMDSALDEVPAATLAFSQAAQMILAWSPTAFDGRSPLVMVQGTAVLRPEVAGVIRAAYDQVLPAATQDASHALRLAARIAT